MEWKESFLGSAPCRRLPVQVGGPELLLRSEATLGLLFLLDTVMISE